MQPTLVLLLPLLSVHLAAASPLQPISFAGGYPGAEWNYNEAPAKQNGIFGWSAYLRAFNFFRETYVFARPP